MVAINITLSLFLFYLCAILTQTQEIIELFVSSYGIDGDQCGDETNPCGTLYHSSKVINEMAVNQATVNVIDGQNRTEISNYYVLNNSDNYDPCLPIPFHKKIIKIIFNPD
eukprot:296589_1